MICLQDLPLSNVLESFLTNAELHALFKCDKHLHTQLMQCYFGRLLWPLEEVLAMNARKKYVRKIDAKQNMINTDDLLNFNCLVQLSNVKLDKDIKLPKTLQILSCSMTIFAPFKLFWHLVHLQSLTILNIESNHCELNFKKCASLTLLHIGDFNTPFKPGALPPNLTILSMPSFNQPLTPKMLPDTITQLLFSRFTCPLNIGVLPTDLRKLEFHKAFNSALHPNVFPTNLRKLRFSHKFNQPIDENVFPEGLVSLTFGNNFNRSLKPHVLPSTLKKLIMSWYFDQPIELETFSTSLEYLQFGGAFNQILNVNVLPSKLTYLNLGGSSRILYKNVLPQSLTALKLGYWFNMELQIDVLPSNLLKLDFGYDFDSNISPGILPSTLLKLRFGACFNQQFICGALPNSLTKLVFDSDFSDGIVKGYNQPFDAAVLPFNLLKLKLSFAFHRSLKTLPLKLQHLYVSKKLFNTCKKLQRFQKMEITFVKHR